MPNGPMINDAIVIDAPVGDVFRALTDAGELASWLATRAQSDPRAGGHFRYEFEFADHSQDNSQEGEYFELQANERVSLPWRFPFSPDATVVTYQLSADGAATRLTFTHTGFGEGEPWDSARARFGPGWRAFLEALKHWVETRSAQRPLGILASEGTAV